MIRNQWYAVLESREVKTKPVGVTRMGEKLVFWRDKAGKVHCQWDKCAHRGAALSKGAVCGDHIQCPFHGFEYDADGRCRVIPANSVQAEVPARFQVNSYPTFEEHGFIFIYWGSAADGLHEPRFFSDIDEGDFFTASVRDPWKAHYSRVIENQLDVVHLPFVHHNTIGRGGRTVVDGPGVIWVNDDEMHVYVYNRTENGSLPKKPEEVPVPDPTRDYRLEFIMPNLWQNRISDDVRIVAAFVPVDANHTLLYLRFYQRFLSVPVLGKLVALAAMPFNLIVAHQDRRIVETQRPMPSGLKIGERLVPGDRPVVEYRRKRHERQQAQHVSLVSEETEAGQ